MTPTMILLLTIYLSGVIITLMCCTAMVRDVGHLTVIGSIACLGMVLISWLGFAIVTYDDWKYDAMYFFREYLIWEEDDDDDY